MNTADRKRLKDKIRKNCPDVDINEINKLYTQYAQSNNILRSIDYQLHCLSSLELHCLSSLKPMTISINDVIETYRNNDFTLLPTEFSKIRVTTRLSNLIEHRFDAETYKAYAKIASTYAEEKELENVITEIITDINEFFYMHDNNDNIKSYILAIKKNEKYGHHVAKYAKGTSKNNFFLLEIFEDDMFLEAMKKNAKVGDKICAEFDRALNNGYRGDSLRKLLKIFSACQFSEMVEPVTIVYPKLLLGRFCKVNDIIDFIDLFVKYKDNPAARKLLHNIANANAPNYLIPKFIQTTALLDTTPDAYSEFANFYYTAEVETGTKVIEGCSKNKDYLNSLESNLIFPMAVILSLASEQNTIKNLSNYMKHELCQAFGIAYNTRKENQSSYLPEFIDGLNTVIMNEPGKLDLWIKTIISDYKNNNDLAIERRVA